jgi:hypothetical protein
MTATHSDHLVDRGDETGGHGGHDHAHDHAHDHVLDPPRPRSKVGARFAQPFAALPPWAGPVAVGGLALTSCIYVGLVDPSTTPSVFYPQCAFKSLTGYDCPGCGLTRAMHALVTGHPGRAIDHNIFIVLIAPLALYTYFVWLSRSLFGWELPYVKFPRWSAYALLPLVVVFWVVRNLPFAPFNYLASGASGA